MKRLVTLAVSMFLVIQIFAEKNSSEKEDFLKLGGAFRYNYTVKSWDKANKKKGGEAIYDATLFRVKGRLKGIEFEAETRYFAESNGGFMLRNGFVALPLSEKFKLKFGMPRTPFGILPLTANSFLVNMSFFLGFEDDSDFGALLEYNYGDWEAQFNFAKNSEDVFSGAERNRRYAFDLSGRNREVNQFTGRLARYFGENKEHEVGFTAQYGQTYNDDTEKKGDKYALVLHTVLRKGNWDLKAQSLLYVFSTKDKVPVDYVEIGAYGVTYKMAKRGIVSSVGVSYKLPVNHRLLHDMLFYNDFSMLKKSVGDFEDSYMNVIGFMTHVGPVEMYVDYVLAKNHALYGNNIFDAFYSGSQKKWHSRFNINLGIYF